MLMTSSVCPIGPLLPQSRAAPGHGRAATGGLHAPGGTCKSSTTRLTGILASHGLASLGRTENSTQDVHLVARRGGAVKQATQPAHQLL
jgi:hypothetical protein